MAPKNKSENLGITESVENTAVGLPEALDNAYVSDEERVVGLAEASDDEYISDEEMTVVYVGKNPSYTVAGIRFDKNKKNAVLDAKIARELIKTGKFIES